MTFDALTMHAIRDELVAALLGGRVEHVFLLGAHGLGLVIYAQHRKHSVLLSADPTAGRVHLLSTPLKRESDAVTPMLLLLRKHVRGGRVEALEQPRLERLLTVRVAKRGDDGIVRRVGLIIEAMGRRSNIVLVDEDGAILDALKRAGPSKNPNRPILPRHQYSPPPPQERLDPQADTTVARLRDEVLQAPVAPRLADLLSHRLAGFSPQLGREVAWRVTGSADAPAHESADWLALRAALDELFQPLSDGRWRPSVAWRDGLPVAFAPYPLRHLQDAEVRPAATMSEALEAVFESRPVEAPRERAAASMFKGQRPAVHNQAAASLLTIIDRRRAQLDRKRASLERALSEAATMDELRANGEAILANTGGIAPNQETLVWDGRTIPLNPSKTAVENAQRYFKEYRKARDALQHVPEMLQDTRAALAYLADMASFLASASDAQQVRALKAELAEAGVLGGGRGERQGNPKQRRNQPRARPRHVATSQGFTILIGTSARCNEEITFHIAEPRDVWLHARDVPGAHVVICTGGQPVPDAVIEQAAQLAAAHSAVDGSAKVAVSWTERRHVRKQHGSPGQVTYSHERTLIVTPLR